MDNQRIIFNALADYVSYGGEIVYDPNISIEQYIKRFEDETKRITDKPVAVLKFLRLTEHNEDGSFKRDDKGLRMEKYIYGKTF